LMRRLYRQLSPAHLGTTLELGCDPAWVEAAAFAWLAQRTLEGLSGNLPSVTGAAGERVLGAIYPGNR
jgi:anhydro-N-acetylmuramic acid kinase